ncbi:MAG: type I-F CRISPR-associated helicase Cas3f [Sphaerochaetaceae bacterium]
MFVIFVSQSEKKAIKTTQRVLDLYANRIGDRTWTTNITQEGLKAIKINLSKNATKNTTVSCHWVHGIHKFDLIWIVGSKKKINIEGIVPVSFTSKDFIHNEWENNDKYLEIIKILTAISALMHDLGKASDGFQKILTKATETDFIRHEWISYLLFNMLVSGKTDEEWTRDLFSNYSRNNLKDFDKKVQNSGVNFKPERLPLAASMISWLIISHHKMPSLLGNDISKLPFHQMNNFEDLFNTIKIHWGYEKKSDCSNYVNAFSNGLPFSEEWIKEVNKWSKKLFDNIPKIQEIIKNGAWRIVLLRARLHLMLGDYSFSSEPKDNKYGCKTELYANTESDNITLKQYLNEHILGVKTYSLKSIYSVNRGLLNLPGIENTRKLLRKTSKISPYFWQDKAVNSINKWRCEQNENFGFFAVNLASTGCGKTFVNAKVMKALDFDSKPCRFNVALGLRTLTLQTGDVYRDKIGLDETELAVVVGSDAVIKLHEESKRENMEEKEFDWDNFDSSIESNEIVFDSSVLDENLKVLFKSSKDQKFIYAPVLVCTIDHLVGATESTSGGRWMLPFLRLITSDLVIDEIDDFTGNDLQCLARLIHTAAMLGRKVMISSATITPDIASGMFFAYRKGWEIYLKSHGIEAGIGCCWIDEFNSEVKNINISSNLEINIEDFKNFHSDFMLKRINELELIKKNGGSKRKGELLSLPENLNCKLDLFNEILSNVYKLHFDNNIIDIKTNKKISFGLVRFANIDECIDFSIFLDNVCIKDNYSIKIICYHSRTILLVRNAIERELDDVLQRKEQNSGSFNFSKLNIRKYIDAGSSENVMFIVVSTPIEEVGRDHDFDWAIIEPSSVRSIIQLAGRVCRHRNIKIAKPNIAIMQRNVKSLENDNKPVFCLPGYETVNHRLKTHDISKLINFNSLEKGIDSIPRLHYENLENIDCDLNQLEHFSINKMLFPPDRRQGADNVLGWYDSYWFLTGLPQRLSTFRGNQSNDKIWLLYKEDEFAFYRRDSRGFFTKIEKTLDIFLRKSYTKSEMNRIWLNLDYSDLLEKEAKEFNISMENSSKKFGYLEIPKYVEEWKAGFVFDTFLGLNKRRENG